MKVSSPVGDFPFTVRRIRWSGTGVVVEGAMGAWPATIEVEPADVAGVARAVVVPRPLVAGAAALLVAVAVGVARGRR